LQEARFGALVGRHRIELIAAYGAEQYRIGSQRGSKGIRGQRRAVLHNGDAPNALRFEFKVVAAEGCDLAQDRDCFVGDFGADAVAGGD